MILYLHGFTSGPQSAKSQALRERLVARGMADQFICPQLPAAPADAIALAEDVIARNVSHGEAPALVGSSLGGYYAAYLAEQHGLKAVLVNPVVAGSLDVAHFVGPQRFLYTGEAFDFTLDHVAQLKALDVPKPTRPERYWLLAEAGDEVLDYRAAVAHYAGTRQTVLPGGDHSFTRWTDYLDDVIGFCQ